MDTSQQQPARALGLSSEPARVVQRPCMSVWLSQRLRRWRPLRCIDCAVSTQAVQREIERIEIAELPGEGDVGVLIA